MITKIFYFDLHLFMYFYYKSYTKNESCYICRKSIIVQNIIFVYSEGSSLEPDIYLHWKILEICMMNIGRMYCMGEDPSYLFLAKVIFLRSMYSASWLTCDKESHFCPQVCFSKFILQAGIPSLDVSLNCKMKGSSLSARSHLMSIPLKQAP